MFVCQALSRILFKDIQPLDKIVKDINLARHYKFILRLILDNEYDK